ncbi:MAG: hypothetical protein COB15_17335 [Flavobacteriales bacterium]|nr:MAG: hypothetical protein COB15_17335 [Flavobacteriales bacterium]
MTKEEYRKSVRIELDKKSQFVKERISTILTIIPEKAKGLSFDICPEQDGGGQFSVSVSLDGPNLYVLNKVIEDYSDLFDVRYTKEGLNPPVPMVNQRELDWYVNDILSLEVIDWITKIWKENFSDVSIVATIVPDELSEIDCVELN